jgi:hypothetical protein
MVSGTVVNRDGCNSRHNIPHRLKDVPMSGNGQQVLAIASASVCSGIDEPERHS